MEKVENANNEKKEVMKDKNIEEFIEHLTIFLSGFLYLKKDIEKTDLIYKIKKLFNGGKK